MRENGTVRPSLLAVLRLMISSTFVICCTGRSVGFSPLRIRPGLGKIATLEDRGHCVSDRQRGELFAPANERCASADHERTSQLDQGCEDGIEVVFGFRVQDMELPPEGAGRGLRVSRLDLGVGVGRVDEQRHDGRHRDQLVQQLQPLRPQLYVQGDRACEV